MRGPSRVANSYSSPSTRPVRRKASMKCGVSGQRASGAWPTSSSVGTPTSRANASLTETNAPSIVPMTIGVALLVKAASKSPEAFLAVALARSSSLRSRMIAAKWSCSLEDERDRLTSAGKVRPSACTPRSPVCLQLVAADSKARTWSISSNTGDELSLRKRVSGCPSAADSGTPNSRSAARLNSTTSSARLRPTTASMVASTISARIDAFRLIRRGCAPPLPF